MLKALELVGFKSFADKTRLEFPSGITVVVGPNGSGKSNIVDAIKWVLGEQSVKSLRGKEMADVIFNGSSGRRALNSAEVTLTFNNSERLLQVDTPEVHITRRVYRSGEGEYLINRQPCRLRDIRDLFAGTGVATEAYSVIEQGKVDVLLQASPRDRRLIFEEAAGISRFKAKKIEAQRRLERVEQNLLRLSDIVEEVESRLRSVRMQASKAQRYKEYADRLQLLRTQVGLVDWRKLTAELAELEDEVRQIQEELAGYMAQAEAGEARGLAIDVELTEIDEVLRGGHLRIAENRERIASCESAIEHQRRRQQDLEEEIARHRRQLTSLSARADDLDGQWKSTETTLVETENQQRELASRLGDEERALTRATAELDKLRGDNEQSRAAHLEKLRAAAALSNRISALEAHLKATAAAHEQGQARLTELATAHAAANAEYQQYQPQFARLSEHATAAQAELQTVATRLAESRGILAREQDALATLRERHSGASERFAVLEELERRQEGISGGVKEVLSRARSARPGPLAQVQGLVADLLQVHIDSAALIETALGEAAQYVVVGDGRDVLTHLQQPEARYSGRVTFLRLDARAVDLADVPELEGMPGVRGRADEFVETAPEHAVLARRLLGRTWIVDTLARAIALAEGAGQGANFVTAAGELLTAEGLVSVGARHAATGLISRRSELRVLRQQLAELNAQLEAKRATCAQLETSIAADAADLEQRNTALAGLERELSDVRVRTLTAQQRLEQTARQQAATENEVRTAEHTVSEARTSLGTTREQLAANELQVAELESRVQQGAALAQQLEQTRQRLSREASTTRIDVTRIEQQVEGLRHQRAQLDRDRQERGRILADTRAQLTQATQRSAQTECAILAAESEVAALYLSKEQLTAEMVRAVERRDEAVGRKAVLSQDVQRVRGKARKHETRLHAKELAVNEARHARTTVEERLREDYAIELAACQDTPTTEAESDRAAVEHEIADLRSKLNSIGSVNLDSLAELEQMETRYNSLAAQHQDLASAKASLEQIINKINADSRRLFAETLELVRGHFQALFRKLFGGGQADITLDEGVDILDSGIEIVARPPGKEPRSISLLSGGEKTLTCVALLLAIFRSRPSPFCVLDEVDAALDEANIERFVAVLHEFLAWTQFIVVTHSKKTMTCASTLYGVTMQESGISKRVSVRFEDVSETGEILNVREEKSAEGTDEQAA